MKDKIILFETEDKSITLPVQVSADTVWLNRNQLTELFGRDIKTIGKHIGNALKEELEPSTVAKIATVQNEGGRAVTREIEYYNLDMIISVGYRVKSTRGVEFRRWANNVLRQYVMQGYAVNQKQLNDLGSVVKLLKRTENSLDAKQVLTVVERYSTALDLLDTYDHQTLQRPNGNSATYRLTYEECRQVIDDMRFGETSDLFELEKDGSFKGASGIYTSLLLEKRNIRVWKKKQRIFFTLSPRIIVLLMEIKELPPRCSCIFSIKMVSFSSVEKN